MRFSTGLDKGLGNRTDGRGVQIQIQGYILCMRPANEKRRYNVTSSLFGMGTYTGIILCMRTADERRRYNVTSSLIGWAHTQNDPWGYNDVPRNI